MKKETIDDLRKTLEASLDDQLKASAELRDRLENKRHAEREATLARERYEKAKQAHAAARKALDDRLQAVEAGDLR